MGHFLNLGTSLLVSPLAEFCTAVPLMKEKKGLMYKKVLDKGSRISQLSLRMRSFYANMVTK